MNASPVFRRTPEGQAALDRRDKRIPAKMRALMLMAEGKPVERFAEFAAALGFGPESLDELIGLGFAVAGEAALLVPSATGANATVDVIPAAVPVSGGGADAAGDAVSTGPEAAEDVYALYRKASGMMRELASDSMGMKAFFFILKIEKCGTLEELGGLVPELLAAVTRQRGRVDAERIAKSLYAIIG
jgi:hypothetical protein